HRDLKPTNLIIPRGENPAAIILDLGHALIAGDDRITQSGLAIGSVSFMAPEQAVGHRADPRSDLYAVGAILYRALTGHPVFVGTTAEVLQAHATTAIVAPRSRAPELAIPREAEDLCLWLLAKNPAERVPSATVLAVTLSVVSRSR
ncbi:MAG: serine/threonine protein kinase, partial [Kofleriaceae bacterium]